MAISSLRLKGFKSFGGQYDFTFSRNFTAIVGPNGSGKSNILDALKWIFGEASASGLRITRQSDLLFQGSSSSPPAETTEVSVKLQNENDRANLRRIFTKENGSALYLDGKKILLQDIDGVKQRFNLEGEGFALIGQGEIAQTIHQRPRERRRQFDSLFGIERYREKRDDSLKKLQDSQSEAQRIQTLIDELKERRSVIADEVDIAVQAQGIIDSLDVLRHDYYFVRRFANEKEQADNDLKKHIAEVRLDSLEKWHRLWSNGLAHYEALLKSDDDYDTMTSKLKEINAKLESFQRRAFQLSTGVKAIISRRKSLDDEISSLKVQRSSLSDELNDSQNEQSKIQNELDEKQREFSEREKKFQQSQEEYRLVSKKRSNILETLADLRLNLSRNTAELNAAKSSFESLSAEIDSHEQDLSRHNEQLNKFNERKNILEESFTKLTTDYQRKSAEIQTLRRELTHNQSQYSQISGTYPEAVRIILSASQKNLIASKPKAAADVFTCSSPDAAEAIEAFLGGRQYWLFVRSIEEAQEGIDFLKANKAGRVTYLPLERCRPRERDHRLSFGNGVIGWAMDIVEVDEQWRDAVSHLMGDLLIVRDYRTGAEIVRSGAKFPIATAEGDIFSPSGTVAGGAVRQKSGAVTAHQKSDELTRKIADLTGKIEDGEVLRLSLRGRAEEAESELENLRDEIKALQRNINSVNKNIDRLKNEMSKAQNYSRNLTAKIEEASVKIQSLENELSTLPSLQNNETDSFISAMRNEIHLLTERLSVSRSHCERIIVEAGKISAMIERSEKEISDGLENERAGRSELFKIGQDKAASYREGEKLKHEISRRQNENARVINSVNKIRAKLSRSSENVSAVKGNIENLSSKSEHLESECSQMIELWEEKYPYDREEARTTEGGRELTSSLRKLERELKSLGAYNLGAISEDNSLSERIEFLTDQLDDVNTSADELTALIAETDSEVERSFTSSMSKVDARFNELFTRLFGGGEARLTLQEGGSVWDRGVEIFARPPGKKLQNISQLSGGEQSLTSIALIFATLEAAGSSLAVLDEVDAALDEYNLVRFAELAREYSRTIQIIAMTHRRATMERADLIYGVTMIEAGLSAAVGIDPENYA